MKPIIDTVRMFRDMYTFANMQHTRKFYMFDEVKLEQGDGSMKVLKKYGPINLVEKIEWEKFKQEAEELARDRNAFISKAEIYFNQDTGDEVFRCLILKDGMQSYFQQSHYYSALTKSTLNLLKSSIDYLKRI